MSIQKEKRQALNDQKRKEVFERDILRVSGTINEGSDYYSFDAAKKEILRWIDNRSGGNLPREANEFKDFLVNFAGRNVECRAENLGDLRVWGVRAEDPDKNVPGRAWKTEIFLVCAKGKQPKISLRLRVANRGFDNDFIPSVPGVVKQIIEVTGLVGPDGVSFSNGLNLVNDDAKFQSLVEYLTSDNRQIPLVIISQIPKQNSYAINPGLILKRTWGVAHIFAISDVYSWRLSEKIGKNSSVFDGGAKVYYPAPDTMSDSPTMSVERLMTRSFMKSCQDSETPIKLIIGGLCEGSLERNRIGHEIVAFNDYSTKIMKHRLDLLQKGETKSTNNNRLIQALKKQVHELEGNNKEQTELLEIAFEDTQKYKERAEEAERQQTSLIFKVNALKDAIGGTTEATNLLEPENWNDFIGWVEQKFAGKIILTPKARKGIKKAKYLRIIDACKSFNWLGDRGISGRVDETGQPLREEIVADGIIHTHCGGDGYEFQWQGSRLRADWHIKSGGNTRDPMRCLRIYYAWEPTQNLIVVSDMPAHIKTDAT